MAKDKLHFFSSPEAVIQIQDSLKYLAPEVPLLAPAALNWALIMHRLFSSLAEESEEMPRSHVQAMVTVFEDVTDGRLSYLKLKMASLNGIVTLRKWHLNVVLSML